LNLNYPVKNGRVTSDEDLDDLEEILSNMMNNELKYGFEDSKVMISEPPNNSMESRK